MLEASTRLLLVLLELSLLISEYSLSLYEGHDEVHSVHQAEDDTHCAHAKPGIQVPVRNMSDSWLSGPTLDLSSPAVLRLSQVAGS